MKISKRKVDNLTSNGEQYFVWDDDLSGFCLQVGITGSKTFICRYRNRGTRRQIKLGRYGALTPEEARLAANKEITHLGQALIKAETTGIPWAISAGSEAGEHAPKSNQVFVSPQNT